MLQLLVLPVIWLAAYLLGHLLRARPLVFRRYALAAVSSLLLVLAASVRTWVFYTGVSLGILLAGRLIAGLSQQRTRKAAFVLSVSAVVLMIVVFLKWRIYFQKWFVYLPSLSYLGFRGVAYLTSVYRGGGGDLSAGLLQMLFFPILFTGPIARVEDFGRERWDYPDVLRRLAIGLAMLIAGHFCAQYIIDHPKAAPDLHWSLLWVGALANSLEYYFTFAGYTHLIIGLGLLTGFKMPENFNRPYLASSISEFWRRWHMSLSYWIRDYLYIPLGGNRKGIARKCVNLMIAMGLCGIWHGLSLNFLVWGLFHGALLSLDSLLTHHRLHPLQRLPERVARPLCVLTTFALVSFGWLLFRYSIGEVGVYVRGMAPW